MDKNGKNRVIFLILIIAVLALGLFLRVYGIEKKVIWYDEADSIATATRDIAFYRDKEFIYKPVYFFLLKQWIRFFGISPLFLRLFSSLFSLFAVYWIYLLGRKIFDEKTGLIAAFFLAVSPFFIYHSQQVRHFSAIALFTIISFYFLTLFLRSQKIKHCILSLFFSILTVFCHPYGAFILLSQLCVAAFSKNKYSRLWLSFSILTLFLYVFMFIKPHFNEIKDGVWWIEKLDWGFAKAIFSTFTMGGENYGLMKGSFTKELSREFSFYKALEILSLIVILPVFLKGIFCLKKKNLEKKSIFVWLALPVLCVILISYFSIRIFVIKHLTIVLPAFYLLLAKGFLAFNKRPIKIIFSSIFIIITGISLTMLYSSDLHINWKNPAGLLRDYGEPGDVVVLASDKEIVSFLYHFRKPARNMLSDIGYWGKLVNGEYRDEFDEQKYKFVLITQNKAKNAADNLLKKDFLIKINKYTPGRYKRIWVLTSRYIRQGDADFMYSFLIKRGFTRVKFRKESGVFAALFTAK